MAATYLEECRAKMLLLSRPRSGLLCWKAGFREGFGAHRHFLSICCENISILAMYLFLNKSMWIPQTSR